MWVRPESSTHNILYFRSSSGEFKGHPCKRGIPLPLPPSLACHVVYELATLPSLTLPIIMLTIVGKQTFFFSGREMDKRVIPIFF